MIGAVMSVFVTGGMWAILLYSYPDVATCESRRPAQEARSVAHGLLVSKSECNPVEEKGS